MLEPDPLEPDPLEESDDLVIERARYDRASEDHAAGYVRQERTTKSVERTRYDRASDDHADTRQAKPAEPGDDDRASGWQDPRAASGWQDPRAAR
jgi:hypothetical protein